MIEEWYFDLMELKNIGLKKGLEKGYTMDDCQLSDALEHFKHEWQEFLDAYEKKSMTMTLKELADLSNMCDLFFEKLWNLKVGKDAL